MIPIQITEVPWDILGQRVAAMAEEDALGRRLAAKARIEAGLF